MDKDTAATASWKELLRAVLDLLLDLKFWQAALALVAAIRRALNQVQSPADEGEAGR